jgi:hypothetical protein
MRWQRSADAAQGRWCDVTTYPDRFLELGAVVVPVVLLGTDAPDQERATFIATAVVNPGAVFPTAEIAGWVGDIELVDAWAVRSAGNLDLGFSIQTTTLNPLPAPFVQGSCAGQSHALVLFNGAGLVETIAASAPANETLHVPGVQGMRIARGRTLRVQGTSSNTISMGFAWRNIGSPTETQ